MICDRCGRKTYTIFITKDYEKVCKRSCKGHQDLYPSSKLKPNFLQGSENEKKLPKENYRFSSNEQGRACEKSKYLARYYCTN